MLNDPFKQFQIYTGIEKAVLVTAVKTMESGAVRLCLKLGFIAPAVSPQVT